MRPVHYDREKFRELLLYIAEQTADDDSFGDTKLNKVLYFADFYSYGHLGRPITGARYQKGQWGPTAVPLVPVRDELEGEHAITVEMRPAGRKQRRVVVARRRPDMARFAKEELEIIDELIRSFRGKTAGAVSDYSHEASPGWQMVELNEDIPYQTALISKESPSEEALERGRRLAARAGW